MASSAESSVACPDLEMTTSELLARLVWYRQRMVPRYLKFMGYYRNPMHDLVDFLPGGGNPSFVVRPYRQYQELGLPTRITGFRMTTDGTPIPGENLEVQRKEVVIENDIAWRINTMVDFALTHLPTIVSTAANNSKRKRLTRLIHQTLQHSGGLMLLQQLLLLGAIHGSSYLLLEPNTQLLSALVQRRTCRNSHSDSIDPNRKAQMPTPSSADGMGYTSHRAGGQAFTWGGNSQAENQEASSGNCVPTDAGNTPDSAGSPDIAFPSATVVAPSDGFDLTLPLWAQSLRIVALPAAGVLPLISSGDGAIMEPNHVVVFHAENPLVNPTELTALQHHPLRGRKKSLRASWLLQQVKNWLPGFWSSDDQPWLQEENEAAGNFDLWAKESWQRFRRGAVVESGVNPLGFVPVVPYVNQVTPGAVGDGFDGVGLSEVEPLLALQDELNTRLSDRASRVTMQSYHMYLIKGLDDVSTRPIGPGQMWSTMNLDASISSFGGDGASPSEESHINEIREALDKISGVSPIAAGLIRGRLGNLTSAVALKITLIALLSRTEKRRAALTETLKLLVRRILEIFDQAGVIATTPEEREIDINWPSALPENTSEMLAEAKAKLELGISRATVLSELGYAEEISGLTGGEPLE